MADENEIPVGKLARSRVAGVTAARIGAKKLGLQAKRPFLSRESYEIQKAKNDDDVAEVLFQGLSKLRGTALKIAQILSLELGVLPDAYRKQLYKSHYQVPPLNRALIRRLMIAEFGRPPEEVFAEFEPEAFAAASLGQVHRARTRDGERVAVKVQYPGIGSALANDIAMVKQFVTPLFKTEYVTDVMGEIDRRLTEEIDYELERRNTQWFHDNAKVPGVAVPRTLEAYSTKLVLATELIEGSHVEKWLATNPSQEDRDHRAQLIYDFFMRTAFELGRLHADPNPGNYVFRDDGTMAVIDFGSIKVLPPGFPEALAGVWRTHIHPENARNEAIERYAQLGLAHGDRDKIAAFYDRHLKPFGHWISVPFNEERCDFGARPEICAEIGSTMRTMLGQRELEGFTTHTVILDRNIYGLFRLFTEMKARVRMRNEWIY